jgi:hypothetical protein
MNYQPDLFVFNIGNSTPKTIYNVIHELGLGKIQYIEIVDGGKHAFVAMKWHTNRTISTRMKLNQGRPLLLHHTETNFWKVYSYENRYIEEMKKQREIEQREKEQREKEQKEKEQKEIEQKMKERDLKMQLLKKEHQEIIMKKDKIYKEKLALEKLIKEKVGNRQPKINYYDEEDTTTSEDYSDTHSESDSESDSESNNIYDIIYNNNKYYDVDDCDTNLHIDYGNEILEFSIIKSNIEKRFARKIK